MTRFEILDILNKIFNSEVYLNDNSKFSVIDVPGTGLTFFTYSEDSTTDCIWYCNIWVINSTKEIKIPNEMTKEFIEEIYEHNKILIKIGEKVNSINKRLSEMNTQESIRDMKLKTILK